MNKAVLYAQAGKLRGELEELREQKALELVELLNENQDSNVIYDWYKGIDPDLDYEVYQYIVVSRVEIKGFVVDKTDEIKQPEPTNFHGYFKYNLLTKNRVSKILTDFKDYTLRRP